MPLWTAAFPSYAFAPEENVKKIPDILIHSFYESPIYLISQPDDPLAKKDLITARDLAGRTLMVGGGSPAALQKVQHNPDYAWTPFDCQETISCVLCTHHNLNSKLCHIELIVDSFLFHQFFCISFLDDSAILYHKNAVCLLDC